jgi:hypothetical protein
MYVRYLTWDSSPQYGRDYELALVMSIRRKDLVFLLRAVHRLFTIWSASEAPWDDASILHERIVEERELMNACRVKIKRHCLPTTLVGFGRSGFSNRLRTLLHAMRLEHFHYESLVNYVSEIITTTQDYGTEKQISRVKPTQVNRICPHFTDTPSHLVDRCSSIVKQHVIRIAVDSDHISDQLQSGLGGESTPPGGDYNDDDVFEEPPDDIPVAAAAAAPTHEDADGIFEGEAAECDLDVSFLHTLETPPCHHINDTITSGLGSVMPSWDAHIHTSQQICKMVRRRGTQQRLLESCFSRGVLGI